MEETILLDDVKISYRVEGRGDPLVLLHGSAFSHEIWDRTIRDASRFFTVYAPDLPGFGCSDKPAVEYGLPYYVGFIERFLDALGIDKCHIAGLSIGGEIAAAFAARCPERVSRLVIINGKGFSPLIKNIRKLPLVGYPLYLLMFNSRDFLKLHIETMLYDKRAVREELVEKEWARIKDPAYRSSLARNAPYFSTVDLGLPDILKAVKARTLIIWGKNDAILPVEDAYKFHDCIENSEVVVLERCGHAAVLERAEALNRALLTFLAQTDLYYKAEPA